MKNGNPWWLRFAWWVLGMTPESEKVLRAGEAFSEGWKQSMEQQKVLGPTSPDPVSDMLGLHFRNFESPTGIHGLAKTSDGRLDVLAVAATEPGTGQFREFIRQAKETFQSIYIWHVDNPMLAETLERYGFRKCARFDDSGATVRGYQYGG